MVCPAIASRGGCHWTSCFEGGSTRAEGHRKAGRARSTCSWLVGDVTGDGRSDLFIGKNTPNGMDVIVGVPGPDLFARRPQDVPVVVPNDEEYAWLVDLNKDGKQDILMHHPFTLRDAHGAPRRAPGNRAPSGDDADRPMSKSVVYLYLSLSSQRHSKPQEGFLWPMKDSNLRPLVPESRDRTLPFRNKP